MTPKEAENLNKNRRNFLKLLLIGGGVLLAGKVLGPGVSNFFSPQTSDDFGSFRVTEDGKALNISDRDGEDILIIDKR